MQSPMPGSQTMGNGHTTVGAPGMQTPTWHVEGSVQASPGLQIVPSVSVGFEQRPDVESQEPAAWHASLCMHATGLAPAHDPA